jgi:hypothetical protein
METEVERDEFKKLRNTFNKELKNTMRSTAERIIVPRIDSRAHFVRSITGAGVVVRKGRFNSVYITTQRKGIKGRAVGYIEFGGSNPGKAKVREMREGDIRPRQYRREQTGDHLVGPRMVSGKRRRAKGNRRRPGAVMTPAGPRAWVNNVRHFKGKKLISSTIKQSRGAYEDGLKNAILDMAANQGFKVTR